jgi:hypothetical protein
MSVHLPVPQNPASKFLRFNEGEQKGREYYVCRAGFRRFTFGIFLAILVGFLFYVIPGVLLLLYYSFRQLKTTHGFATITSDRILYYEYNEHPTINYRSVRQVNIRDVSAIKLTISKWPWRNEFVLTAWTPSALGLAVGATRGLLASFSSEGQLEPGPDADEFVQQLGSLVANKRSRFSTPTTQY